MFALSFWKYYVFKEDSTRARCIVLDIEHLRKCLNLDGDEVSEVYHHIVFQVVKRRVEARLARILINMLENEFSNMSIILTIFDEWYKM